MVALDAYDRSGKRDNTLGASDMIGNVWEWVGGNFWDPGRFAVFAIVERPHRHRGTEPELHGGGFLDNLESVYPFVRVGLLEDGIETSHTDVGFRLAALVPDRDLPVNVIRALELQPPLPPEPHETLSYIAERTDFDSDY